jgi:CubicO group peptidase (beta-lactamase class C family)
MFEGVKRLQRLGFVAAFTLATSSALAQGQTNPVCGMPVMLDDGWTVASPESVGLDGTRLCGIEQRLKFTDSDVHAVLIARHGRLVFEQYFSGLDQPWGKPEGPYDYDATTKHDMRSASKSIVSLLVGLAIDRRLIASVNEPVAKFFPELSAVKTTGWDNVTLRHLLTMSSGIKWDETLAWTDPKNDEPHLGYETDPVRYVLSKPIVGTPDTMWVYNGGGTDLLGNILERVSGKSLEAFAREFLFQPLEATDFEWKSYPKNGRIAAAAGLRLRPRDAAKIGQLILSDGAWNGRQVVPPDWIMQSVIPRFQATGYFGGILFYGYQWWMGRSLAQGKEVKWIAAMGWGGQRIFVIPDLDMVVMTTSGLFGRPKEGMAALDILSNSVIPSVRDKQ